MTSGQSTLTSFFAPRVTSSSSKPALTTNPTSAAVTTVSDGGNVDGASPTISGDTLMADPTPANSQILQEPEGSGGSSLMEEQRAKIEANRLQAMQKLKTKEENFLASLVTCEEWKAALSSEWTKPYCTRLSKFVQERIKSLPGRIFPAQDDIFNAINSCPLSKVKVVILGQDPYHGPGQAHGLSFSVLPGVRVPPSLRNMYKELKEDPGVNFTVPKHGSLQYWCNQGVLLLNACLTVEQGKANSHAKQGWEDLTAAMIQLVSKKNKNVVFLLWGLPAQKRAQGVDASKHLLLKAAHPSPLSASKGFFGCRHFSKTNAYLKKHGIQTIDWQLPK